MSKNLFNFTELHKGDGFYISKAIAKKGASFTGLASTNGTYGVQFITKGSLYVLNIDCELDSVIEKNSLVKFSNPHNYQHKRAILVAKEDTVFHCIVDKDNHKRIPRGDIFPIKKGKSLTLNRTQGKYLYNTGKVVVDDYTLEEDSMVKITTKDTIKVTALEKDTIVCLFYVP